MQSPDHPQLVFLEALTSSGDPMYTIGRPDGKPLWVVIHDMEANEGPNCAEATATYFHNGAGGRSVSSHYTADDTSIVQCVLLKDSAWTVGNRPGNRRGINWELCGFAAQTRAQWLDAFGRAMFGRMVPIIQSDAAKYGIPLVRRTVAELRAWVPGVTSHNDLGLAFGGTDHTDPGVNFPWDVFMATLTGAAPPRPLEDRMFAIKERSTTAVWLSNGVERRGGITWVAIMAMHAAGLIQTPTAGTDSSGFVFVVPDGQIEMYAGPDVGASGGTGAPLTPEQVAVIAAAAKAGAEAGAPTAEELEQAAFEGAQRAEDE